MLEVGGEWAQVEGWNVRKLRRICEYWAKHLVGEQYTPLAMGIPSSEASQASGGRRPGNYLTTHPLVLHCREMRIGRRGLAEAREITQRWSPPLALVCG